MRDYTLNELQCSINIWQRETFPHANPASIYSHMTQEMLELEAAIASGDQDRIMNEAADVAILLLGLAGSRRFYLQQAINSKMKINRERKWGEADENGVINHTGGQDNGS